MPVFLCSSKILDNKKVIQKVNFKKIFDVASVTFAPNQTII